MKSSALRTASVVVIVGAIVLTLPAAIAIAVAEWFPASWLIELQVRWNGGYYYGKLTFLLTWLALLVAVTTPVQLIGGLVQLGRGLLRTRLPLARASRWRALRARVVRVAGGAAGGLASLLALGACAIRPDIFDPLGFLASIILLVSVVGPAVGLLFFLDGLCPVEVLEGPVEALLVVDTGRGGPTYQITLSGRAFSVNRETWASPQEGTHVRVALSGYLGGLLALERPDQLGDLEMA